MLNSQMSKFRRILQELEALKDRLETQEMTWKINLTDAQKEADQSKREVSFYHFMYMCICRLISRGSFRKDINTYFTCS